MFISLFSALGITASAADFRSVEWESKRITATTVSSYSRMCGLSDGTILLGYSNSGIKVIKSRDGGLTWGSTVTVASPGKTADGYTETLANTNLYELGNGVVLCGYRAHTPSNAAYKQFYSAIRVSISYDYGETWDFLTTVVENTYIGSKFTGFWEPDFLRLADGSTAIYYANDCIGGSLTNYPYVTSMKYQNIMVHIYDPVTETFGEPMVAQNGEKHNSRDGMPVLCTLSDGTYAMVIESSSLSEYSFHIRISFSEDGITWSAPRPIYYPNTKNGKYAGAPGIACLPDGRIAVCFQTDDHSGTKLNSSATNNSVTRVIISNNVVTNADKTTLNSPGFTETSELPFRFANNMFYVWPSVCVIRNTLYVCAQSGMSTGSSTTSGMGNMVSRSYVGSEGSSVFSGDTSVPSAVYTAGAVLTGAAAAAVAVAGKKRGKI